MRVLPLFPSSIASLLSPLLMLFLPSPSRLYLPPPRSLPIDRLPLAALVVTHSCPPERIEILKRLPKDPKPGYIVKVKKQPVHTMCAVPYELLA